MMERGINVPTCSSAGRLFDAVAAALGLHADRISHEGQAAMALEALARPFAAEERPWRSVTGLDWELWRALLDDLADGVAPGRIAARFHLTLAQALADVAARVGHAGQRVVLSGGVMQNRVLLAALRRALRERDLVPLSHCRVPANDGGLALGQGIVAALAGGVTKRKPMNATLARSPGCAPE
jgi:hydrogenase maturation protein HypF